MNGVITAIAVVKFVILALGGGITFIAYKGHRRTGAPALRALAVGFGTITLGALLAGIAHQLLGVALQTGVLINSLLVAIGLAIIMYSLYLQK
jgi:hypothetical protein